MVSQQKKQLVQQLIKDIDQYPIVGVLNLQNLPAQQLQAMRAMLKQKVKGMPALLFTKDNPFALNVLIERNKSEAPAKAGQTAPRDIVVKAGPTSFAPGPILSELAAVGIKT